MIDEYKQIREALMISYHHFQEDMAEAGLPQDSPKIDRALDALSRIEAREAETPKDTLDLAMMAEAYLLNRKWNILDLSAEIERLIQSRIAAAPKTVPMAMLEELVEYGLNSGEMSETSRNIEKREIAARYGYAVEEERNG